jgi:hypothetical protein
MLDQTTEVIDDALEEIAAGSSDRGWPRAPGENPACARSAPRARHR